MVPLSRLRREEIRENPEDDETTIQIENSFMNQSPEYISSLLTTQPYSTVTLDTLCRNYCLKYGIPITESVDIEFHDDTRLALKKIGITSNKTDHIITSFQTKVNLTCYFIFLVSICEDHVAYFCNELSVAIHNRQERRVMDILIGRSEVMCIYVYKCACVYRYIEYASCINIFDNTKFPKKNFNNPFIFLTD